MLWQKYPKPLIQHLLTVIHLSVLNSALSLNMIDLLVCSGFSAARELACAQTTLRIFPISPCASQRDMTRSKEVWAAFLFDPSSIEMQRQNRQERF